MRNWVHNNSEWYKSPVYEVATKGRQSVKMVTLTNSVTLTSTNCRADSPICNTLRTGAM